MLDLSRMNKPHMTLDLIAPEGNVYAMIAKAMSYLPEEYGRELLERFDAMTKVEGTTYQDMKNLVSEYCEVTWLNTPEDVEWQNMIDEWDELEEEDELEDVLEVEEEDVIVLRSANGQTTTVKRK